MSRGHLARAKANAANKDENADSFWKLILSKLLLGTTKLFTESAVSLPKGNAQGKSSKPVPRNEEDRR